MYIVMTSAFAIKQLESGSFFQLLPRQTNALFFAPKRRWLVARKRAEEISLDETRMTSVWFKAQHKTFNASFYKS